MQRFAQLIELAVGEVTPSATRDAGEVQRADTRAHEPEHRVADLVEHAAHDAVTALVDHHAHDRTLVGVANWPHDIGFGALIVHHNTAPQLLERRGGRVAIEQRFILLVELKPRVHDPVGDLAVVGEQQQPFCRAVETTNRDHAIRGVDQVHDGQPVTLVRRGRDIARGFV